MDSARIGYCRTFVSPEGDAAEERALNFRGPTISLVARQGPARLEDTVRGHSDMMWNRAVNDLMKQHLAWCDIEVEAKSKNLASRQLVEHCRAELLPA